MERRKEKTFSIIHPCFFHLKNANTCLDFHKVVQAVGPNWCFSAQHLTFGNLVPTLSCLFSVSSISLPVDLGERAEEAYSPISKTVSLEKCSFLSMLELWMNFPVTALV